MLRPARDTGYARSVAREPDKFMGQLAEKYKKEVVPHMMEKFGYKNRMAVPKIEKVVVNTGIGKGIATKSTGEQKKNQEMVLGQLAAICGQRPVLKGAKKSIAGFKLREGMPIGVSVTLRGKKMYDFLERLVHIALPRSRDFRGIDQKSFDKAGNLTIGIKEHIIFPEVSPEEAKTIFGFEVTVVTTSSSREEGVELLKRMGFPIKSGDR